MKTNLAKWFSIRKAGKDGNTHYSFYNDYKPELKQETTAQPDVQTNDDLPF